MYLIVLDEMVTHFFAISALEPGDDASLHALSIVSSAVLLRWRANLNNHKQMIQKPTSRCQSFSTTQFYTLVGGFMMAFLTAVLVRVMGSLR